MINCNPQIPQQTKELLLMEHDWSRKYNDAIKILIQEIREGKHTFDYSKIILLSEAANNKKSLVSIDDLNDLVTLLKTNGNSVVYEHSIVLLEIMNYNTYIE